MAKLESLIRFQKHRVDEKQKILARLFYEEETLQTQKKDVLERVEEESKLVQDVNTDPILQISYSNFLASIKIKIAHFDLELEKIKTRIDLARDDIRTAFEELKKTEIVERNRKKKESEARRKKETLALDEMGLETYRRKKKTKI